MIYVCSELTKSMSKKVQQDVRAVEGRLTARSCSRGNQASRFRSPDSHEKYRHRRRNEGRRLPDCRWVSACFMNIFVWVKAKNNDGRSVSNGDCETPRRVRHLRSEGLCGCAKSGGDAQASPFPSELGRQEHSSRCHRHHDESKPAKTTQ